MKINNFRGELTDNSAKKEALPITLLFMIMSTVDQFVQHALALWPGECCRINVRHCIGSTLHKKMDHCARISLALHRCFSQSKLVECIYSGH